MITMKQALNANEFHFSGCAVFIGPRGGKEYKTERVRRNGRTQTWKTRPGHFRIPCKYGLYTYVQIWHHEAESWHTAEDCKPKEVRVGRV
jgi:hypothetical protein